LKKFTEQRIERIIYASDASCIQGKAMKVMHPENIAEIKQILARHNVTVRGAGTGLAGGAVPQQDVVIDMSRLNRIIEINKERKYVVVEAGIVLADLNMQLSRYGLEFPVKPSSHEVCTIGGMIATNALGLRALKYGSTRDWVLGLEVIDGKGMLRQIAKPDVKDFASMEGITGIIVRAKLRLVEIPSRNLELMRFESLKEMISAVRELKREASVSMLELIDRKTAELLGLENAYYLFVEREGKKKNNDYDKLMKLREGVYSKLAENGYTRIEDPQLYMDKLPKLMEWLERNHVPYFGHVAIGLLHPCFSNEQEKAGLIDSMHELVKKLRGKVSGEHGIGLLKKKFLADVDAEIISRMKRRYDPEFKINRGKVIDVPKNLLNDNAEDENGKEN